MLQKRKLLCEKLFQKSHETYQRISRQSLYPSVRTTVSEMVAKDFNSLFSHHVVRQYAQHSRNIEERTNAQKTLDFQATLIDH